MIKLETLSRLGLNGLIGTPFEDVMVVRKVFKGDVVVEKLRDKSKAFYIYKGSLQVITYTEEGKSVYIYRKEGEVIRSAQSLLGDMRGNIYGDYGVEICPREDSIIVYLPLEKIVEMNIDKKDEILKRLLLIVTEEKIRESSYLIGRIVYSDEELILKALDKAKIIESSNTRELSKALNMNLRNLQRILNKLQDIGIVDRVRGRISIKDEEKFYKYKKKVIG